MSSESMESSLQFFLLMSFLAAVVLGSQYFQGRRRARIHETIELAIRQGQPVPPELLELLARREGNTKPPSDLRWGLIAVSVGVGLAIFGQIMGSIAARSLAEARFPAFPAWRLSDQLAGNSPLNLLYAAIGAGGVAPVVIAGGLTLLGLAFARVLEEV